MEKIDLVIIDDDSTAIKIILRHLEDRGLTIRTFTDPIDGLQYVIHNPPRIIFLDYNMPEMTGKELIIKLSQNNLFQYSSVFLITAIELDELKEVSLKTLGFSSIIRKPFNKDDLYQAIESVGK